jgi:malate dehydrogenase (oxaloacetate-decarboxylating)(NADP+)
LLSWIDGAQKIGPILMVMSKPAPALQRDCAVEETVTIAEIAGVDAQETEASSGGDSQPNEQVAAFLPTAN